MNIYRESHVIINNLSFSLTPSLSISLTDNLRCNESAINSNKRLAYTYIHLYIHLPLPTNTPIYTHIHPHTPTPSYTHPPKEAHTDYST